MYGFPKIAGEAMFTPGQESKITSGDVSIIIPKDMYTEPLKFELLLGDEKLWQACVPDNKVVIAPYAYRITDPSTGKLIGRVDKPVSMSVTDPRIASNAEYWSTSAANPPTAQLSSAKPQMSGATFKVDNGSARVGWFVTVPRR